MPCLGVDPRSVPQRTFSVLSHHHEFTTWVCLGMDPRSVPQELLRAMLGSGPAERPPRTFMKSQHGCPSCEGELCVSDSCHVFCLMKGRVAEMICLYI